MISGEIVEGERQAHIQFWYVLDAYTSALQATPNYVPTVLCLISATVVFWR